MARWLENTADCFDEIGSEYDPGSEYAALQREWIGKNLDGFWTSISDGNPEVKFRLGYALRKLGYVLEQIEDPMPSSP